MEAELNSISISAPKLRMSNESGYRGMGMQTKDKWTIGVGLALLVYGVVGDTNIYDPEAGTTYDSVVPIVLGIAMIAYSIVRSKGGKD